MLNDELTLVRLLKSTPPSSNEIIKDDLIMARITSSRRSDEIPDEQVISEFKRTANSKSSGSLAKSIIKNAIYAVVAIGATAGFFALGALMTLCFG